MTNPLHSRPVERTPLEFTRRPSAAGCTSSSGLRSARWSSTSLSVSSVKKDRWELAGKRAFAFWADSRSIRAIPLRRILLAVEASEPLRVQLAIAARGDRARAGHERVLPFGDGFPIAEPPPVKLERPEGSQPS